MHPCVDTTCDEAARAASTPAPAAQHLPEWLHEPILGYLALISGVIVFIGSWLVTPPGALPAPVSSIRAIEPMPEIDANPPDELPSEPIPVPVAPEPPAN